MRVQATVRFGRDERTFIIACGDGKKSFRWLGMTAAVRFSMPANGLLRHQETLRTASGKALLHPSSISSAHAEFYHPDNLLLDYMQDGDEVLVTLTDKVIVDERGGAAPSPWSVLAFGKADASEEAKAEVLRAVTYTLEEPNRKRFAQATLQKSREDTALANVMRSLLVSQCIDDDKVRLAFEHDWTVICRNHAALLDTPKALPTRTAIQGLLLRHFVALDGLYHFYCGAASRAAAAATAAAAAAAASGEGGGSSVTTSSSSSPASIQINVSQPTDIYGNGSLSSDDVIMLVRETGAFGQLQPSRTQKLCIASLPDGVPASSSLSRASFFAALIRLANLRFIDTLDAQASFMMTQIRSGSVPRSSDPDVLGGLTTSPSLLSSIHDSHASSASSSSTTGGAGSSLGANGVTSVSVPSLEDALEMLIELILLPVLTRVGVPVVLKLLIWSDESMSQTRRLHETLSKLFMQLSVGANIDPKAAAAAAAALAAGGEGSENDLMEGRLPGTYITLKDLADTLKDAQLIPRHLLPNPPAQAVGHGDRMGGGNNSQAAHNAHQAQAQYQAAVASAAMSFANTLLNSLRSPFLIGTYTPTSSSSASSSSSSSSTKTPLAGYPEFVEALLFASQHRYAGEGLGPFEKVRLGLTAAGNQEAGNKKAIQEAAAAAAVPERERGRR